MRHLPVLEAQMLTWHELLTTETISSGWLDSDFIYRKLQDLWAKSITQSL